MHERVKQSFLQACMNHGCVSKEMTIKILEPLCQAYGCRSPSNLEELKKFVKDINSTIGEYNQALTMVKHPLTGEENIVFGLTHETIVCKQQMHYTDADKHYFSKLLEAMAHQEDYGLEWVDLYAVVNTSDSELRKQLTKTRMKNLLQKWTNQGYFLEKDEKLYFGPRMLVEYATHLTTEYADVISKCPLCSKLVLWAVKCSECSTKIHRECIRKYLIRMSDCPSCKKTWNVPIRPSI